MGKKIPKTHLFDPQEIFRELELTNLRFNSIIKKAHQIDARYPNFSNKSLPAKEIDRLVSVK